MNEKRYELYKQHLKIRRNIRINERLRCVFRKFSAVSESYEFFTADLPKENDAQCNATIHHADNIMSVLNRNNEILLNAIESYFEYGSNYELFSIAGIYCNIDKYQPLKA